MYEDCLEHFGFREDPLAYPEPFESADFKTVRAAVRRAAKDRAWLLIHGEAGSGKSYAAAEALAAGWCKPVRLMGGRWRDYSTVNIDMALFAELTDERPRRSREARRRQLERILGQVSRQDDVVLFADEATDLPNRTMSEIKFLRDILRFGFDADGRRDRRPLFSVVVAGWPGLHERIMRSAELRPRVRRVGMAGLSRGEVPKFIAHLGVERLCPKDVADALAASERRPLHVIERLREGMDRAWLRGAKKLAVADVALDLPQLFRQAQQTGLTARELAREADVSESLASRMLNGNYPVESAGARDKESRLLAVIKRRLASAGERTSAAAG